MIKVLNIIGFYLEKFFKRARIDPNMHEKQA